MVYQLVITVKSEICYKKQCKHQAKHNCEKIPCSSNLTFNCHFGYCARDKQKCEELLNILYLIKLYKSYSAYTLDSKREFKLVQEMHECPISKHKLTSMCKQFKNCYTSVSLPKLAGKTSVLKPINCPCRGKLKYQCGNSYCAVNKEVCQKHERNITYFRVLDCDSNFQLINKNH